MGSVRPSARRLASFFVERITRGWTKIGKSPKVLYISYDGMTDPLGQSQVIAYLRRMARQGFQFDLVSFEKSEVFEQRRSVVEDAIRGCEIRWHPLRYTKRPPVLSTAADIAKGWRYVDELYRRNGGFDIVHCRSYVTSIIGLHCRRRYGTRFVFDMRGWLADERRESGQWASPAYRPVYNLVKRLERDLFRESDLTVSLTHAGQHEIVRLGHKRADDVLVVPTCVDFDVFRRFDATVRTASRRELSIPEDAFVLCYSGSLGGSYRTDVIVELFQAVRRRRPDAVLLFLTMSDPALASREANAAGIPPESVRIHSAEFQNVHRYLMAADAGVVLYTPQFSVIGRSPTKLGEYWASGLPVLAAKGIGDVDSVLEQHPGSGVLFETFTREAYDHAVDKLLALPLDRTRLRRYAEGYYSIDAGVAAYVDRYRRLLGMAPASGAADVRTNLS